MSNTYLISSTKIDLINTRRFLIKKIKNYRLKSNVIIQFIKDLFCGYYFMFSKNTYKNIKYKYDIHLEQKIIKGSNYENKIFNLTTASNKINDIDILPNEIFSFWTIVGNPNKDLKYSRSIVNGRLSEEKGGGLCQIAGLVYYVSMLAGLKVLERHNHSVDIYDDETRFAPLGTDAAVVYGYKDLRIQNTFEFPIKYKITINKSVINIFLFSTNKINKKILNYKYENYNDKFVVKTIDDTGKLLNESKYKILD